MLNISDWVVTRSALRHRCAEEEILGALPAGGCTVLLLEADGCYHLDDLLPGGNDVYEALCEVLPGRVIHLIFCHHDDLGVVFHAERATRNIIRMFEKKVTRSGEAVR